MGELSNCAETLNQKKVDKRKQPISSPAPVFINEEDLPVENGLVEEPNNRREAKSMLKKLNLKIELCVPFSIKGEEWIQRLFVDESALSHHGLREVAQSSNDCIIIFYDSIPLIPTHIITKHRGAFIINNEFQGKISLWTFIRPFHKKVNC